MAKEFSRLLRIEQLLSRKLAELVCKELSHLRLGVIAVSGVSVSKDLAHAKVFVTLSTEDMALAQQAIAQLDASKAHIRKTLAKTSQLRTIPNLRFIHDVALMQGRKVDDLISRALKGVDE